MTKKEIILVDKEDNKISIGEKLKVHKLGRLHRAFSIFIFNSQGEVLLQKRAKSKYHSPLLWTNTCCSHPRPNKDIVKEAKLRLKKEMGIKTELKEIFTFIYRAKIKDLIEYEFDHVFVGKYNGNPKPNKREVSDWRWVNFKDLKKDLKRNSKNYTYWFKKILDRVIKLR